MGSDMAEVSWDDGTEFYRDVQWPQIWTREGIACTPDARRRAHGRLHTAG